MYCTIICYTVHHIHRARYCTYCRPRSSSCAPSCGSARASRTAGCSSSTSQCLRRGASTSTSRRRYIITCVLYAELRYKLLVLRSTQFRDMQGRLVPIAPQYVYNHTTCAVGLLSCIHVITNYYYNAALFCECRTTGRTRIRLTRSRSSCGSTTWAQTTGSRGVLMHCDLPLIVALHAPWSWSRLIEMFSFFMVLSDEWFKLR